MRIQLLFVAQCSALMLLRKNILADYTLSLDVDTLTTIHWLLLLKFAKLELLLCCVIAGSFATATCMVCQNHVGADSIRDNIMNQVCATLFFFFLYVLVFLFIFFTIVFFHIPSVSCLVHNVVVWVTGEASDAHVILMARVNRGC